MPITIFVYGTLKPAGFYFSQYCEGRVSESYEAIAQGRLFDLPMGYPAMTEGSGWVYGYALTFTDAALLRELDELEGYEPDRPAAENEYQRKAIAVYDLQHQPLGNAWTYVMSIAQAQQLGGTWLPEGRWQHSGSTTEN